MKRFEYFLSASGIKNDEQKKALLLHIAGEEIQDIYETLDDYDANDSYTDVKGMLEEYFKPKKNVSYERHLFRQANQEHGETVDNL